MSSFSDKAAHRQRMLWVCAIIAIAGVGAYELVPTQPGRDVVAVDAPLRFDAPAAGPDAWRAAYRNCIAHPAPDGSTADCLVLLKDDSPQG